MYLWSVTTNVLRHCFIYFEDKYVLASLSIEISKTDDRGAGQETCAHVLAYVQQHAEV